MGTPGKKERDGSGAIMLFAEVHRERVRAQVSAWLDRVASQPYWTDDADRYHLHKVKDAEKVVLRLTRPHPRKCGALDEAMAITTTYYADLPRAYEDCTRQLGNIAQAMFEALGLDGPQLPVARVKRGKVEWGWE
jgi:hypothetical protein